MQEYDLNSILSQIKPPLKFREPGGEFEGEVMTPRDIFNKFEPMDVLNGAIELIDANGHTITVRCNDQAVIDKNEYPLDYKGIYFVVQN